MRLKTMIALVAGMATPIGFAVGADEKPKAAAKVSFADQVGPIFRARCNSCHNADKQKGGLNLETYGAAMQGGASGKVVEAGDVDGSRLFALVNHSEEPKMPPMQPKLPDAELAAIKAWIEAGAPETSGSVVAVKAKPKFEFKLDPSAMGKPVGPPAMPENLSTEPVVVSPKANAVVAIAASPWAPIVAVAGHKQILIYHTKEQRLLAVFPFPEGTIHTLKFSRNGSLLLAGGGRGGQSGLAVVYDVKNGKRVFEIGKEYDAVLAADISPDHSQVALGGPGKIVRIYSTADGQQLFEMKKHTEWITAIEFSPDGVLLASGDRNNGLMVWEAQTGREFHELRGHATMVTDVSWRLDSNVLASCSEDGTVRLWEMENGGQIKSWGAHGGGAASIRFAKDGRLVTTGRDRVTRVWDQNGGKQRDLEGFNDLGLRAVFTFDDLAVVAGDWSGEVREWSLKDGRRVANLLANPVPVAARLEQVKAALPTAESTASAATKELAPLQTAVANQTAAVAKAQTAFAAAQAAANQATGASAAADKALADKAAAEAAVAKVLTDARNALVAANTAKAAAEKALVDATNADKAAADALEASKKGIDAALADKAALDLKVKDAVTALQAAKTKPEIDAASASLSALTIQAVEKAAAVATAGQRRVAAQTVFDTAAAAKAAAPAAVAAATANVVKLAAEMPPKEAALAKATAEKTAMAKPAADAKAAATAATTAMNARKTEFDAAVAAKAAADKTLADKADAVAPVVDKAQSLKLELQALTTELANAKKPQPKVANNNGN